MTDERGGKKLTELRVVDLKDELERRNLETKGNKAALTERLAAALALEGHDPKTFAFATPTKGLNDSTNSLKETSPQPDVKDEEEEEKIPEPPAAEAPKPTGSAPEMKMETKTEEMPPPMEEEEEMEEVVEEEEENQTTGYITASDNADESMEKESVPIDDSITLHPPAEEEEELGDKPAPDLPTTAAATPKEPTGPKSEDPQESEARKKEEEVNSGRHLWVTGLASNTRAADLKSAFAKHGVVKGAKIVTSAKHPGNRCFGFVSMGTAAEAAKCIQHLHRSSLCNRSITVEPAKHEHFPSASKKPATAVAGAAAKIAPASKSTSSGNKPSTDKSSSSSKQPLKRQRITPPEGSAGAKKPRSSTSKDPKSSSTKIGAKKDEKKPSSTGRTSSVRDKKSADRHRSSGSSLSASAKRREDLRKSLGRGGRSGPGYIAPPARARGFGSVPGRLAGRLEERRPASGRPAPTFRRPSPPPPPRMDYASRFEARQAHRLDPPPSHLSERRHSPPRYAAPGGRADIGRVRDEREELLEQMRIKEAEHRQKEEQLRLEKERERLKFEREKLEREKLELQQIRLTAQLSQQQGGGALGGGLGGAQPLPLLQQSQASRLPMGGGQSVMGHSGGGSRFGTGGSAQAPPSLMNMGTLSSLAGSAALEASDPLRDSRKMDRDRGASARSLYPEQEAGRRGRDSHSTRDDRGGRGREREDDRRQRGRDGSRGERRDRGNERGGERGNDRSERREPSGVSRGLEVIDYGHGRGAMSGSSAGGAALGGNSALDTSRHGGYGATSPYRGSGGVGGRADDRGRGGGRIEERGGWGPRSGPIAPASSNSSSNASGASASARGMAWNLSGAAGSAAGGGGGGGGWSGRGGVGAGGWGGAASASLSASSGPGPAQAFPAPVSTPSAFNAYAIKPGFTRRY